MDGMDEQQHSEQFVEEAVPMKKGPWTAEEDAILVAHVNKYGEGHWTSVQKYSGLPRSGKSCCLRWANHLRPMKKGPWTPEEDAILVAYVIKFGRATLSSVRTHTGLPRSGKSCRLRWVNHLQPSLRNRPFTQEEKRKIWALQATFAIRQARMAAQRRARMADQIPPPIPLLRDEDDPESPVVV